jgi:RNA polymerase sigma-70 factor (ECF subfamily)
MPALQSQQLPPLTIPLTGQSRTRSAHTPRFEEELALLFDAWRNGLLRYLLSSGLSVDDGEEVVQEVFLALFQHLVDQKPRNNLRGWAFRVAHNLGLKRRIASNRRMEVSIHSDADAHIDSALNPEQQAAASQRQTHLESLVRALPEQDRCCLVLRAEGLRYREIAEILGISLGSVAGSLARSLSRIARADKG